MHPTSHRTVVPQVADSNFTELDHRLDRRMRGVLGEYMLTPEATMAYSLDRDELFDRVDSMVGNTPLLHVEDVAGSAILAKVESQNPTENHYDRVFPRTIQKLEQDGVIEPGDELVEVTSGSGGRAFAWAARVLGYDARLIIPPELPAGRVQDMINFGAELEVTEPGYMQEVSKVYVDRINRLEEEGYEVTRYRTPEYNVITGVKDGKRVCYVNHSANEISIEGFDTIGEEIAAQMPDGAKVDYVVSVMGNGTSTTALSRTMRRLYPDVKIAGLEDERSPHYFEMKYPGEYERKFGKPVEFTPHDMFGSSAPGVKLRFGKVDTVDEVRLSNPAERDQAQAAYNAGKRNFEKIGKSSAAGLVIARQLAAEHPGSNILTLFYDKADQYGDEPLIATRTRFMYDRPMAEGVIGSSWRQQRVGSVALLPKTIGEAHFGR